MPDFEPRWPRAKKPAVTSDGPIEEVGFSIEQWSADDTRLEEVLGRVGNVTVARVAFREAVRLRPGRRVLLRQSTRVVADSAKPTDLVTQARESLDDAVADAIAICGADVLDALRAALVANEYLEAEIERLAAALSGAAA